MNKRQNNMKCFFSIMISVLSEMVIIFISNRTGQAIDYATKGDFLNLYRTCISILILTVVNNILFLFAVWINQRYIKEITVDMRVRLVDALFKHPLYTYRKKEDSFYSNMLTKDIDNLGRDDFGMIVVEAKFLALFIGAVLSMYIINPWLFGIALIFSFMPMLVTYFFEKKIQAKTVICSKENENMQREVWQFVQGYEVQKINCVNCSKVVEKIRKSAEANGYAILLKETLQCAFYMVLDILNSFGRLLLIGIGGYMIIQSKITTGQLVSCTILTEYVCSGINNFLEIHMGRKAYSEIRKKIDSFIRIEDSKKCISKLDNEQLSTIEYVEVSVKYEGENNYVLENISKRFCDHKFYLIVGRSGCGKSTFVKLLINYYKSYEGKIFVEGKNLTDCSDEFLYSKIGYLNQNEMIFNETMMDNITLFNGSNENDLYLHELINSLGLGKLFKKVGNRKLGDFGETISGGERQRIALARVLYKKPKILILDEPFTGLDSKNKELIMDYVESLDDMIRIIISHEYDDSIMHRFDEVIDMG